MLRVEGVFGEWQILDVKAEEHQFFHTLMIEQVRLQEMEAEKEKLLNSVRPKEAVLLQLTQGITHQRRYLADLSEHAERLLEINSPS
jgi:hypothetical protein